MKRAIVLLLCSMMFVGGCTQQETAILKETEPTASPSLIAEEGCSLSAASTATPAPEPPEPTNRIYIEPIDENPIIAERDFHSLPLKTDDIKLLADTLAQTLNTPKSNSLNSVLKDFDMQLKHDMCFEGRQTGDDTKINEDDLFSTSIREQAGYTFVTISDAGQQYRLVFRSLEENYLPQCLIVYDLDFGDGVLHDEVQEREGKKWFVWLGQTVHGTGESEYEEKWYSLETGALVLSIVNSSYNYDWDGMEFELHTSISDAPVITPEGFVTTVTCRLDIRPFMDETAAFATSEIQYELWYDGRFYMTEDPVERCYTELLKHDDARVVEWAKRRIPASVN